VSSCSDTDEYLLSLDIPWYRANYSGRDFYYNPAEIIILPPIFNRDSIKDYVSVLSPACYLFLYYLLNLIFRASSVSNMIGCSPWCLDSATKRCQ